MKRIGKYQNYQKYQKTRKILRTLRILMIIALAALTIFAGVRIWQHFHPAGATGATGADRGASGAVGEGGSSAEYSLDELTALDYEGEISIPVNRNRPLFTARDLKKAAKSYESYSDLDKLGRCGPAEASISTDTMPQEGETRTSIGSVTPSGWQKINFWCRCHLIGYQLTAENANENNLITGTTRLNMSGMLPYENEVAAYIAENPDSHVLYRVTPLFAGDDLVASGVNIQAESVEDRGAGVSFNAYIFNYQPGYIINYEDGSVADDPDHQTRITLCDKTANYTGEPVTMDGAEVTGSTGDIKYIYYTDSRGKTKTDEACGASSKGAAPAERGTYYVRAVVSGDNWYPARASEPAQLTIR